MRLHWFSPLPPAETGIADYTVQVLAALRDRAEIVICTTQAAWDPAVEKNTQVRRYQPGQVPWAELNRDDVCIYHIGNNPRFHEAIWQASRRHSGVVVLHDLRLQHLFAGLYRERWNERDEYLALMERCYGSEGRQRAEIFWCGGLTTEYMAERYPLTSLAVENALGVLVHSKESLTDLKWEHYCPVSYAPLPFSASPRVPQPHAIATGTRAEAPPYRLIVFGYITVNRGLDALLQALAGLPERDQFRLDIYGRLWDSDYVRAQTRGLGLQELVAVHGFVPAAELNAALAAAHLAVNLRNPTMGGASISQLQIWDHARPTLVSRAGWYATLPEDAVAFVRPGHEIIDIRAHLSAFLASPTRFAVMGERGRRFLEEHHTPEAYAQNIVALAAEAQCFRPDATVYKPEKRVGKEHERLKEPAEPRLLLYMGNEYADLGELDRALDLYHRYVQVSTWDDEKYLAQVKIAALYRRQGKYEHAVDAELQALKTCPQWPHAYFGLAQTYYFLQAWPKVIHWVEVGWGLPIPDTLCTVNPMEVTYSWIIYYTNALYHVGRVQEALEWTHKALEICPGDTWHLANRRFFAEAVLQADPVVSSGPAPAGMSQRDSRSPEDTHNHHIQIRWGANILNFSGYARYAHDALFALDRWGISLGIQSFAPPDEEFVAQLTATPNKLATWQRLLKQHVEKGVAICFHLPALWDGSDVFASYRQGNPGSIAYVGITMFETDRLPAGWAAACNGMDEIWVPSTFNRETFAQAGVDRNRLQVIPFGLDTQIYEPSRVLPMDIPGRRGFTFLSVFQWSKRKGWDVLLKAYLSTFAAEDDVCLVLRTYPSYIQMPSIRERIDHYVRQRGYDPGRIPPIILLEEFIPEGQMPGLYAAANAFVLPTRGEGWGIPFMEAMAMGLPVIATRWSGHLDFINDHNSYLINIEGLVPVDSEQTVDNPFYTSDQRWAEPSVAHTAALMRHVYDHQDKARTKGAQARRDVQRHWSLDHTAEWIIKRVAYLAETKAATPPATSAQPVTPSRPVIATTGAPAPTLVWHAPIFDCSGYADETRQFVLGLDSLGVHLRAVPLPWSKAQAELSLAENSRLNSLTTTPLKPSDPHLISVFHILPPHFRRISGASYHIGRTMFETDRIPEDWVAACNQMDEIWVPCDFNMDSFARSGVLPEKLLKMPAAMAVEGYRLDIPPLPLDRRGGFNFLSVFDWHWRKGWDVLLRGFVEEFRPEEDVALILKVWSSGGRPVEQLQEEALSCLRLAGLADELPPNVVFYQVNLPSQQLPGLYRAADAFVLSTRGEGWGRPFMEAMLMELPVIGTCWSGQLEFMNDDNAYLIDCQVVDVPEPAWREVPAFRGHRWAEPSLGHLRRLMRQVFEDRQAAHRKGQAAREHIIAHFSRERIAQRVRERLEVIIERREARGTSQKGRGTRRLRTDAVHKPLAVIWEGSQFVHHSLALVNRELCLQLLEAGHELSIIPYEPDQFGPEANTRFHKLASCIDTPLSRPADVYVRHYWPPNSTPPPEGRWVIIQPWEFGSLPKDLVELMNTQVDEVWVPSSYVHECYVRSGVPMDRVHVVPNGVDPYLFHPGTPPLDLSSLSARRKASNVRRSPFKFLFVGGTIWRKGIDVLLQAYLKAFTRADDVCLIIKDMGVRSFYKGHTSEQEIHRLQALPKAPAILYLDDDLPTDQLPGLYTACDCLVHPYRGEGFGLPIAEAMACGLPVIITNHGAALDFCAAETAYLLPAVEKRLPERRVGYLETVDHPWLAEPDAEALARLMRHVYEHPEEARARGARASARIRTAFTWEHGAQIALARLQALRERPIRRHQR